MYVKDSEWEVHRVRPAGGFPFSYAWVNNAGIIEGTLNKIQEINKRGSDLTTQPLGLFAKEAMLTGNLRWQNASLNYVYGTEDIKWFHRLKLAKPEWKPVDISVAMLHSIHKSSSLDEGTIEFLKKLSTELHEPDLFTNSSANPLYFFFLREGLSLIHI